jgi:acetoacetate decarboxylase
VFELVKSGGFDREATAIWEGEATLEFGSNTIEDLHAIRPLEMMKGFKFSFAYTVHGGEVILQHDKEAAKEVRR